MPQALRATHAEQMVSLGCSQATARRLRHQMHDGDADSWSSVRKPLISDDGPVARGFYEHPRLAVTIPCAILVRILRDHLGPLRTVRRPGSGTKQR